MYPPGVLDTPTHALYHDCVIEYPVARTRGRTGGLRMTRTQVRELEAACRLPEVFSERPGPDGLRRVPVASYHYAKRNQHG